MFFTFSKLLWAIFSPLTLTGLLIVGGAMLRRFRAGRAALATGVAFFVIIGFLPVGQAMLVSLENEYPRMTDYPPKVDGIIVLGGAIDLQSSAARQQVQLNQNGARISEMLILSRLYPQAKIVFSGGDGSLVKTGSTEAMELYSLLKDMGFPAGKILYEGESRNTYENMIYSRNLVHPKPDEVWLLVTSAFHMPRSMAIFESGGWNVIPYPAGYLTDGTVELMPSVDVLGNFYKFHIASRERVGSMAYTLTGRINPDARKAHLLSHSGDAADGGTASGGARR